MVTPEDFSEYYKTISNPELVHILENPSDFQVAAVEAAKKEFSDRQLSDDEITEAKQVIAGRKAMQIKQKEKLKDIEVKVKSAGNSLIETLNPIETGIPSIEKTIRIIIVVFACLFLYDLIANFRTHLAYARDISRFPFESAIYILPVVLLPIAIITFWRKKSIGWFLLTLYVTFFVVTIAWALIPSFFSKPSENFLFDQLVAPPSILTLIIQFVFFGGTLYMLCKKNMREIYSISESKMAASIGIAIGLFFFTIYAFS
jgi:hypothetical protein